MDLKSVIEKCADAKSQYHITGAFFKVKIENLNQIDPHFQCLEYLCERLEEWGSSSDNIQKNVIPKEYNVQNLWRVELTNFWRMLYTIRGDQIEIICFIIDIVDHDKYNKKFGYRKR